jgi:hypothetical protein
VLLFDLGSSRGNGATTPSMMTQKASTVAKIMKPTETFMVLLDEEKPERRNKYKPHAICFWFRRRSGADVMITIFCDFHFFCEKNGFFLKNRCYDHDFFQKLTAV